MTQELLPCPFCGGEATINERRRDGYHFAECEGCAIGMPPERTRAEAIAAWNTRASTADLQARLDAAEQQSAWIADRSLEASMLAHRWMVAHDCLKAGKSYALPTAADLPDALARLDAAEGRIAELVGVLRAIQKTMDGYRSQMKFCDVEALGYFREFDRRVEGSGFRQYLATARNTEGNEA